MTGTGLIARRATPHHARMLGPGMTRSFVAGLFAAALFTSAAMAQEPGCAGDTEAFGAQDYETFNASPAGWQSLAYEDCFIEAAEAISTWHRANAGTLERSQLRALTWNAGLMRAAGGDYQSALFLFRQTFPEPGENPAEHYYTYAVIAFLERDRDGLQRIRDAMASMPAPAGGAAEGEDWPPNLSSVDRLLACYESSFAEAIVGGCMPE